MYVNEFLKIIIPWTFFKALGLAPGHLSFVEMKKAKSIDLKIVYSRYGSVYNFILAVTIITLQSLLWTSFFDQTFPGGSGERDMLIIIYVIMNTITTSNILFHFGLRQKSLVRAANCLVEIDQFLFKHNFNDDKKGDQIFGIYLLTLTLMGFVSCIMVTERFTLNDLNDWWYIYLSHFIAGLFILQYSLVIKTIALRFSVINKSLDELTNNRQDVYVGTNQFGEHNLFVTVEHLRTVHYRIFLVSKSLSRWYSFPITISLGYSLLCMVHGVYFIILNVLKYGFNEAFMSALNELMWLVIIGVPIFDMCRQVDRILVEIKEKSADLINELSLTTSDENCISQLDEFSMYLFHLKPNFSGSGMFSLDSTMLHSIISATTSYLIICIQFQIE